MVEPTAPMDDEDDDLLEHDDVLEDADRERPDGEDVAGDGQEPPD